MVIRYKFTRMLSGIYPKRMVRLFVIDAVSFDHFPEMPVEAFIFLASKQPIIVKILFSRKQKKI